MKGILGKGVLLMVLAAFIMVNCSSVTRVNSIPQGAKVYVDDQYLGITPYDYSDTKILGSMSRLKLVKEGYNEFSTTLSRNEKFEVGPCIGGVFCLFPFLWVQGYNPERTYELNRK